MIKRIDTKSGKIISYVYNLKDEDYKVLSERLEIEEDKIKNVIDEEIFTPRISKSDWEIYKLYYPTVKKSTKDKEFTSYEINPIVIFFKEDKIVILDDDYYNDFYQFVEEYAKLRDEVLEENRFYQALRYCCINNFARVDFILQTSHTFHHDECSHLLTPHRHAGTHNGHDEFARHFFLGIASHPLEKSGGTLSADGGEKVTYLPLK